MATKYVTQSGAGAANGTSLGNAWSVANHNAATLSAGDIVILNGTITSQIVCPTSGSVGNVITYQFAAGCAMSAATWTNGSGAIVVSSRAYITIDGMASGTIGGYSGNSALVVGYIEATANGAGLANTNNISGVYGRDCQNITVQNLMVRNMYVRSSGTDNLDYGYGVNFGWNGGTGPSGITVTNCIFHDMYIGSYLDYGPACVGYTCSQITAYNVNWGGAGADHGATSAGSQFVVHDCYLHDWTNWDQPANSFHHNGWYFYAESGGSIADITIYNCFVGPNYSLGSPNHSTSGIFVSGAGITGTMKIYNCVFIENSGDYPSNGLIFVWPGSGSNCKIYNNTFSGGGTGIAISLYGANSGTHTFDLKNNLCIGKTFISVFFSGNITLTSDNNLGYNLISGQEFSYSTTGSSSFKSWAQWQSLGFDAAGVQTNPTINGNYSIPVGSTAAGAGADTSATLTTDFAGTARTLPYDIGAYEAATAPPAPSPAVNRAPLRSGVAICGGF